MEQAFLMAGLMAGGLGAFIGLAIAIVANVVVLPAVLKAQEDGFVMGRKTELATMSNETLARLTRFFYRVPMPIIFAFVGFFAGLKVAGGH
ncbi:hypothetical protein SAMN04515647_4047 [Cohaesibacter sp. ES.047]|uniref:hypothetical protein n=1 Tax=Cohaesibacter sp. ES.047 TaxID=1798205 RepID=UPI000BB7049D|nr:hypothetical protein [Cohaesibacter sp. ES.047]SNY93732.1 hypothetical protein SAMN04515647_4047 [Cohaesibacter sp. ES.047]